MPALWQFNEQIRYPAVRVIGALLLAVYALSYLTVPQVGGHAQTLLVVVALVILAVTREAGPARIPLILLALALVVQTASWSFAPVPAPEFYEAHPKLDRLARWFLFIGLAVWLRGGARNVFVFWSLCLGGFLLAPWITGGGWAEWGAALAGERVDFGIHNAQHTALMFGTALIGLSVFFGRFVLDGGRIAARFALWAIPFMLCLAGVAATQTRGVWIALAVSALTIAVVAGLTRKRFGGLYWTRKVVLVCVGALLVLGSIVLAVFSDHIFERFGTEQDTVIDVLQGNLDEVPYDSAGIRMHSWAAATAWIAERPWFGWGKRGSAMVMQLSEQLPDRVREKFGHLHSSYLDVLVQHGIAGLAVMLALFGWLAWFAVRSWRSGLMPNDVFLFTCGFLAYWLVTNAFESFMFYSTGRFVFNLVAAGVLAMCWPPRGTQDS